jgi:xanthine/uracil/vitamin C permease (AzgA family)
VLRGFGVFDIATGEIYRLPIPVQPMKAIAAMALVSEVAPASIALSGMLIGGVLLFLGTSGLIDWIARLVPQSVLAGLQLGLGLSLGWIALRLMQDQIPVGLISLGIALAALRFGTHASLATLLKAKTPIQTEIEIGPCTRSICNAARRRLLLKVRRSKRYLAQCGAITT